MGVSYSSSTGFTALFASFSREIWLVARGNYTDSSKYQKLGRGPENAPFFIMEPSVTFVCLEQSNSEIQIARRAKRVFKCEGEDCNFKIISI